MSDPFASDDPWSAPCYPDDPLADSASEIVPADPYPMTYLNGLNPVQREAVEALDGPVLLLAGAGTGKTRVLTTRLAHLLMTRRASPFQILAVTFTNKAAREMRERVASLIGAEGIEGWWLGTFHALAARILRRHAELVGLHSNFTILDTDDQLRIVKQLLEAGGIDAKKWPPRRVLGIFERWKDRGLTPDKVGAREAGDAVNGRSHEFYAAYQDRLRTLNACDFGDLLLHTLTIFQNHPDVLAEYHRKFRYILVDEYQDTNVSQYLWLRLLAQGHRNLCCVGDEDQSIYGWRGAEIGNILRFEKDFPGATVIRLEENYRSTGHILAAASGLIANNRSRLGKTLWTAAGAGEKVRITALHDSPEEARWVCDEIESLQRKKMSLGQMAVLVRTGAQTREFEERLMTVGLPYRVVGGLRFYERQEIRDALAYLRVIVQPADDLAFERIINLPKRGIGPAVLQLINQVSRGRRVPMTEATWQLANSDELKPKPRLTLQALARDFERWRDMLGRLPHTDLARQVLDESGYTRMWQEDKSPEAPGRLENLKELISAMAEFENLQGFLEHVALVMEANEGSAESKVSIMTLHGAKGLEFDAVFLAGWEDGLFPSQRALEETGQAGLEEERRLAYVGLTRARKVAYVCYAHRRRLYSNWVDTLPSRFLVEMPADHVEADLPAFAGTGGAPSFGFREAYAPYRNAGVPRPRVIEASARRLESRAAASAFKPGTRVFHQKFGNGTVIAVDHDKLEIDFDNAGIKKVIDTFISAE
ncbi:MAG: UvrD-helicase domain-containing protein [Rhodospirillaceae bacterium]